MKNAILCLSFLGLCFSLVFGREQKEYDSDLIYDESKIPHYDLPPLLVTAEGKPVTTADQWRNVRRPQILSLFSNLVYGRVPAPESPIKTAFEVKKTDPSFMGGKATRTDVRISFSNDKGSVEMHVLVFVPNKVKRPVPAFMKHSFNNTRSKDFDVHFLMRDRLRNNWPLGLFFDRGYAFVVVYQQDLVGHNETEFLKGIHRLFYKKGQSFPKAREWGVLSAVGWGAMRALDYLETRKDIDHTRVAIMGHSKMGKAALWTAAQDERFAVAISAQSGCAGAALWRRRSGETLKKMVTRFPYWLCRNAWKFVNQEDDLPVDQHMLLACIAPRPVYVHSGVEDTWADGRGEYLSAYHASEAYRLLGKKGLTSEASPPVGEAIIKSDVGYHIRKGGHSIEMYDWERFLDFADYHLKKKLTAGGGRLDKAIQAGDFSGYFQELSAWLDQKAPAGMTLPEDARFLNTLAQRQLLAKHGVDELGAFAKADAGNKTFLAWLLRNTEAMELYLVGATPTGIKKREANDYKLNTASLVLWRKLIDDDPDSRQGIYLKLAIATAISPPPPMSYVGAGAIGAVPIDPLERYRQFKSAHKNGELFPIFDTLSVWEYRKLVDSWASDADLRWVRNMVNTWRPDLRKNQQVHRIVSEVWRRNSPFFFTKGFVTVMAGGGKCGPQSWFGRMTCRAFGIPSVGVGQPGHAAFAIKAADPSSEPQPGSVWKVVYGRAWHVSKCEGVSGPEFLAEAAARSHEPAFSQGERLRWLAATVRSKKRAETMLAVAGKMQKAETHATQSVPLPETPSLPERPYKVGSHVLHVEAESFAGQSGILVYDCFTGGKQVNFQKNMETSWIDYALDVPAAGTYLLIMRVATPNRDQVLDVSVDVKKLATVPVPNTTGLWGTTEVMPLKLEKGKQTLRFSAPYQRGIALRWFELEKERVTSS